MKKLLWLIITIMILLLTMPFLIPPSIVVSGYSFVHAPDQSTVRGLCNTAAWKKWWPGEIKDSFHFSYNNSQYTIQRVNLNNVIVNIENDGRSWQGSFSILNHGKDSSALTYEMILKSANTYPFGKIANYFAAQKLKSDLTELNNKLDNFLSKAGNIYGIPIIATEVKDSSYMSISFFGKTFPDIQTIYATIDKLQSYVTSVNGNMTGEPMLNVVQLPDSSFQTMIAVPINRDLPASGNIKLKKMVLGNILEAEVTGGWATIVNAEQQLRNFVSDYRKESPAIPFQTLLNDRMVEKDTAKWKTKLSYPIF